ncbi:MAG: hypothetical protein ACLFUH_07655 [Bacteroidales bacterium]
MTKKNETYEAKAQCAIQNVGRSFIVNQNTCDFNIYMLEKAGWKAVTKTNHIFDWIEYEKDWLIQDEDGSGYKVTISLRQHENVGLLYVNGQWVGRCLYIREAKKVVKAIKDGCR